MPEDEENKDISVSKTLNLSDRDTQRMLSKNPEFAQNLAQHVIKLDKDRQKSKEFTEAMEGISEKQSAFHWKLIGAYPTLLTQVFKGNKFALAILILFIVIILAIGLYKGFAPEY